MTTNPFCSGDSLSPNPDTGENDFLSPLTGTDLISVAKEYLASTELPYVQAFHRHSLELT